MKKSRSVLAVTTGDVFFLSQMGCETVELSKSCTSTGNTLGVDLRRGRRRFSGTLQLPPLSWRQGERARTPERDPISRPTTLQLRTPPRIAITPVDQDRWVNLQRDEWGSVTTLDWGGGKGHGGWENGA
uniref:Uncharacterized protein n=1 Tax=Callorhinchus milii TaxID=7868 RepID=A0A4W3JFG8_CALMI